MLSVQKAGIFSQGVATTPGENLGPELILNGGFDNTNNWTVTSGTWVIANGVATVSGTPSQYDQIYQNDIPITEGTVYRLKITTINGTYTPQLDIRLGGFPVEASITSDGAHEFDVVSGGGSPRLYMVINSANAFTGSIDNISLKEIL